jgi:type IV secretory pathway TraG/TraD family ATPase VirD4
MNIAETQNQRRVARVVEGKSLVSGVPKLPNAPVYVPTKEGAIYLRDEGVLDSHVLLLGGIGQGKTNAIYHLIDRVQSTMGKDDVAVIFDPKGDYLKFRRPEDVVINDPSGADKEPWNLLAELGIPQDLKGGAGEAEDREETASEIAHTLFDEARQKTQQVFFPTAAMQLFAATLRYPKLLKKVDDKVLEDGNILQGDADLTNNLIFRYWNARSREQIVNDFQSVDDLKGLSHYISGDASSQAMGVLSEVVQVVGDVFLGRFRDPGRFSIRQAVRNRGGRCIFIEYRVRSGKAQAALYRILIDLAIKEALSCSLPAKGRVFFFLDEFRLLPRLAHLDNGVNFGREFGMRFIAGMQTHTQIKAAYGDDADSILSGFNTIFAFRTTNPETRGFIQGIAGRNKKLHIHSVIPGQSLQQVVDGQVVEDHQVWDLTKGQAIVFTPNLEPFVANIELHPKKRS